MGAYAGYIVQTFVTLLAVCALAVAVLYGSRKLGLGRPRGPMELVGTLPIDARRSIYLVRIGAHVLVVGASEAGLTKLAELSADAVLDLRRESASFRDVLAASGVTRPDAAPASDAITSERDQGAA